MASDEDMEETLCWLKKFCTENGDCYEKEDIPIRVIAYYVSSVEIPGACMNWTASYLEKLDCPLNFSMVVQYHISKEVELLDIAQNFMQHDTEQGPQTVASEVAKCVFNKVHKVCHRWQKAYDASSQLPYFIREYMLDDKKIFAGACADQNRRKKMEDRYIVIPNLNNILQLDGKRISYYGVYDGHGGSDAVQYTLQHLHLAIAKSQHFPKDLPKALEAGFLETDRMFVAKSNRENLRSGSTAVVVVITPTHLYVTWVGDSQAILARNQTYISIMEPHKPDREDEKRRIEELGGCVVWYGAWRVNGTLSVSRAIGDAAHKPYVTGTPDMKSILLDNTEDFVIVGCDGLWDVIHPWEAVEMVVDYVKEFGVDADKAARYLVTQAEDKGSQDNVTVIVIFFEDGPLITSCRPPRKEESQIFPVPIAMSPEAQAILERLDRSVRGTCESPELYIAPPTAEPTVEVAEVLEPASIGVRPPTPRSGRNTPHGDIKPDSVSRGADGVTPHGLIPSDNVTK